MTLNQTIFDLRFGSDSGILPTQEELKAFLNSPKKHGSRELRGHGTALYGELLQNLKSYGQRRQAADETPDFREKMFYFVLGHSRFFNPALKSAVEQYQYHLHALATLDFRKPTAFIMSAEAEMRRLNPKKRDEAAKLARLGVMVEDRKRTLKALKKRQVALPDELSNIARYVRDNLVKIEKLCETAIVVLVNTQVDQRELARIVAEVREYFKERLIEYQSHGAVPRQYLDAVKNDVEYLSKNISRLFREDIYALAGLYEAIHDHVRKAARELDALLAQAKFNKGINAGDDASLYAQIEDVLVSLVSGCRFEVKASDAPDDASRGGLLLTKRKEMLDRLFGLLQQERRKRIDRRHVSDRRRARDPHYKGPERRSGNERRSGKSRRKT